MAINIMLLILSMFFAATLTANSSEVYKFSFEESTDGWIIPDWSFDNEDYVATSIESSDEISSDGTHSLKINCDFPGDVWKAGIIELPKDINLRGYKEISMDVFLPKNANTNLIQARVVVGAGPLWFIETKSAEKLRPGKWTTVKGKLDVSERGQLTYWKCEDKDQCLLENLDEVHAVSLRIEYNANPSLAGRPYNGPIYVDNIVIE